MSLSAESRLVLIRVKIERANKHLLELESDAAQFVNLEKYVIGPHDDPQARKNPFGIAPLPLLPFNVIATAGDILHNLRGALDHLAWHLAEVGLIRAVVANCTPSHEVGFPIGPTVEIYEAMKRRKVQGMVPEAVRAIDRLKPYRGGNDTLWRLHELDIIDKHQNLITVGHDYLFTGAGFDRDYWLKTGNPHFDGIVERITEPKTCEDLYFGRQKPLTEPWVIKTKALLPTLHQMMDVVDDLIGTFLPLLE